MLHKYWLPRGNEVEEFSTENNSIIIIGANGAGKSKLGAWIENKSPKGVHRIGAQRKLSFNENTPLRNLTSARNLVLYGSDDPGVVKSGNKGNRWNWGHYTTHLIDDYDAVLSAMVAMISNDWQLFFNACRSSEQDRVPHPNTPRTVEDKLYDIWQKVFPHRGIKIKDGKFWGVKYISEHDVLYSATEMSDGERSALYLISQVLCVPENRVLIIDEPELHLHRTIMSRLWLALEQLRQDCLFVYITHDTHFASRHVHSDKIWVKSFDGRDWDLQKIAADESLPSQLLMDILGSRKKVLFVEGRTGSYDMALYTELLQKFYIVPSGSCEEVIRNVRAFRASPLLHENNVWGLVDRDFRTNNEILVNAENGILTLEVAEIENMFLMEPVIRIVAEHMTQNPDEAFEKVRRRVVDDRFSAQIQDQICKAFKAEMEYTLKTLPFDATDVDATLSSVETVLTRDRLIAMRNGIVAKYEEALRTRDYVSVLQIFNSKGLLSSVGELLSVLNKGYADLVVGLLRRTDETAHKLRTVFLEKIPDELKQL